VFFLHSVHHVKSLRICRYAAWHFLLHITDISDFNSKRTALRERRSAKKTENNIKQNCSSDDNLRKEELSISAEHIVSADGEE